MGVVSWLVGGLSGVVTLVIALVWRYPWIKYDFRLILELVRALLSVRKCQRKSKMLIDIFEDSVNKNPEKTFLIYQDNRYSYKYINSQANKTARLAQNLGWKKGDTVAFFIHNEPAFIWTYLGLLKVGVEMAFLNFNLRSKSLVHCVNVSSARAIIVGKDEELQKAVAEIYPDLDESCRPEVYIQGDMSRECRDFTSYDQLYDAVTSDVIDTSARKEVKFSDKMCYIYTSGTTGLPKAAVVTQLKGVKACMLFKMGGAHSGDVIYTPLPLYHSAAGLLALGATIKLGATLVLRRKFSASHFWEDCRRNKVTVIQYIGELCRYLVAQPPSENDKNHQVRLAYGNGLRRDIWEEFQTRFRIKVISEFYAATEGNALFVNLHNLTGSIGRLSPVMARLGGVYLIKYDQDEEEPLRNEKKFCMQVKPGEAGLLVSKIRPMQEYDGYRGNRELSDKKVIHDVFRKGDKYFNSGDLLVQDQEYFLYFSDRIGDTFRWKGENVSTIEVSNVISDIDWIEDANVYGVEIPGQDGRCGMAAITLKDHSRDALSSDELAKIYRKCEDLLPGYARPRFLRVQKHLALTSTFKQQKFNLVQQGFDPSQCEGQKLYCLSLGEKKYIELDKSVYEKVLESKIRM